MPGLGKKDNSKKKALFSFGIGSSRKEEVNNNQEEMRSDPRRMEHGILGGEPRPTRVHPAIQRSQTEPNLQLDWNNLDLKYTKIGRNGYRRKDLSDQLKHLSVNGLEISSHSMRNENLCGEETYAGRRDVSDPSSVLESQIVSSKGTVRGFKNRVRAGIATFLQQQEGSNQRNYKILEKGKIIIYSTSMTVIRQTHERCKKVKKMLQTHMVRYEERDLFMSKENQKELQERLGTNLVLLPQVFADGSPLGSLEQLEMMNESGELRHLLNNFTKIDVKSSCEKCGGYRFIPCTHCHGSKKSLRRNNFTDEFSALRCMQCDENGLLRCDLCLDQQE
ncbi:hypothetical protein FSP39_022300 [Pinctada imbricata]|uniref:Glutaredoxin domain-containing protein n=1 Tax=Pinctada imbricata TaxID=66713 RepID=A0AA89BXW1_PINIB|nr:hypothetical protein FSP39_022300 [Pinctada imbricata]